MATRRRIDVSTQTDPSDPVRFSLEAIRLHKGDVLVVRYTEPVTYNVVSAFRRQVEERLEKMGLADDVLLLCIGCDADAYLARKYDMEAMRVSLDDLLERLGPEHAVNAESRLKALEEKIAVLEKGAIPANTHREPVPEAASRVGRRT